MNERRFSIIISAAFLIVGILATWSTIQLHSYINETLPRDDAQEQCQSEILTILKDWVDGRIDRDATVDDRDDASLVVLDKIATGQQASPADITRLRDAIAIDNAKRLEGTRLYHDLPDCSP